MTEVDCSAVEEIQNCNTEDISLSASQLWIVNQAQELDDDFLHDTARELNRPQNNILKYLQRT